MTDQLLSNMYEQEQDRIVYAETAACGDPNLLRKIAMTRWWDNLEFPRDRCERTTCKGGHGRPNQSKAKAGWTRFPLAAGVCGCARIICERGDGLSYLPTFLIQSPPTTYDIIPSQQTEAEPFRVLNDSDHE